MGKVFFWSMCALEDAVVPLPRPLPLPGWLLNQVYYWLILAHIDSPLLAQAGLLLAYM